MITVNKEEIILEKTDREFENEEVINPATIQQGDNVQL